MSKTIASFLVCGAAVAAGAARAKESYDCTFTNGLSPQGQHEAQIEVNGIHVIWTVLAPVPGPGGARAQMVPSKYQLLVDNDRGLAAAMSDTVTTERLGLPFGVSVIILEKKTGHLRMDGVLANGAHDILEGTCQRR